MTTTQYGSSGVTPRTNVFAAREMLAHALPVMVLDKTATVKQMPKNKTETITMRRPRTFDAVTSPLTEGVSPSPVAFGYDDVSVALRQYGMTVRITDRVEDLHEDPVGKDAAIQAGQNIGRTMEALNWAVVRAGTNVFYANGSQRTDVNTTLTLSGQRRVVRGLLRQKAKPIMRVIEPGPEFATRAVEAAFVGIAHTDLESDIRNLPGFLPTASYGRRKPISEQEIGSVENVRYLLSPDLSNFPNGGGTAGGAVVSTGGSAADVYPIVYFGQDAWATVALAGYGAIQPTIIPVGLKTKDDPLGQFGIIGWKTYHAAVITNQAWMARLEVAATAL